MKTQVVSFHYTLKDKGGKTLESSLNNSPVVFMEGVGQIIPGLEKAMKGMIVGGKKQIDVTAADAYGEYDKNLIIKLSPSELPEKNVKVGQQFRGESNDGLARVFIVKDVSDKEITLDGNHPLAGQDLSFEVEVIERREATEEELTHGHAHGPGGHHHH